MRTAIPEKLLKIAEDIQEHGSVNVTRLTVLKKWFERSTRLKSFAVFIAKQASGRKGKTTGEAAELFKEARALLAGQPRYKPTLPRKKAEQLYENLRAFQSEYEQQRWGPVRIIHNLQLLLVEKSLRIYLSNSASPSDGYRLAAQYCENYDPRYGQSLNGPSYTKIHEIVRFMFTVEGYEEIGL